MSGLRIAVTSSLEKTDELVELCELSKFNEASNMCYQACCRNDEKNIS